VLKSIRTALPLDKSAFLKKLFGYLVKEKLSNLLFFESDLGEIFTVNITLRVAIYDKQN